MWKIDLPNSREAVGELATYNPKETESFASLPFEASQLALVEEVAAKLAGKNLRHVVLIGIGGSSLGAQAIYQALGGRLFPYQLNVVEMHFVETIDEPLIVALLKKFSASQPAEVIFITISKSGTTLETKLNTDFLKQSLAQLSPVWLERLVVIGSNGLLDIPASVGGRFSVFSSAGLLPLTLAKVNVAEVLAGARQADLNEARRLARWIDELRQKDYHILDLFFFSPDWTALGDWCRQLLAESLGKSEDRTGQPFRSGPLPTISLGTRDLHSTLQFYLAAPAGRATIFLLPSAPTPPLAAIAESVLASYQKRQMLTAVWHFPAADPGALGRFLQTWMLAVACLGELWSINVFNQPLVEEYKTEVKKHVPLS